MSNERDETTREDRAAAVRALRFDLSHPGTIDFVEHGGEYCSRSTFDALDVANAIASARFDAAAQARAEAISAAYAKGAEAGVRSLCGRLRCSDAATEQNVLGIVRALAAKGADRG